MIKPKVKIVSEDDRRQVIELEHPETKAKFVIFHYGAKFDVTDEAAVRELWKAQLDRKAEGINRE
jgi:hypothetical protein